MMSIIGRLFDGLLGKHHDHKKVEKETKTPKFIEKLRDDLKAKEKDESIFKKTAKPAMPDAPDTIFKEEGAQKEKAPAVDPYQKQTEPYASTFDTNKGYFPDPVFPAGVPIGVPSEEELAAKVKGA